ncbi:cell envelope biogenesis protein, putative [Babesia ovata]|uniref:Cell envelope biogenesis protein, putative n=1 Tax=Babesia ovata TaxID=189622 RepID=A0A2H6K8P3_9APIC|nr:cell envelope biogenesis protein, putative [Babesia ovata]GBE59364.1 cell envelope biogenesis protein, putative [Babesia ovata]
MMSSSTPESSALMLLALLSRSCVLVRSFSSDAPPTDSFLDENCGDELRLAKSIAIDEEEECRLLDASLIRSLTPSDDTLSSCDADCSLVIDFAGCCVPDAMALVTERVKSFVN